MGPPRLGCRRGPSAEDTAINPAASVTDGGHLVLCVNPPVIYTQASGVAAGIQKAMDTIIILCSAHPQVAVRFLTGEDKVICAFWQGDPTRPGDFVPERGDGRVELLYPGTPGYQMPPTFDQHDAAANLRAGVPLWLLHSGDAHHPEGYTLAVGALHPVHNSITADLYCPVSRHKLCRAYFGDPRRDMRNPHEDWPSFAEQKAQIEEAGGTPDHGPCRAPRHRGFLSA